MKHFTEEEIHKMQTPELFENLLKITEEIEKLTKDLINQALQNKN